MHPLVEILFSLILSVSGIFLIKKMSFLKKNKRTSNSFKSFAEKRRKLLKQKILSKWVAVLFMLTLIISIGVMIDNGTIIVTW